MAPVMFVSLIAFLLLGYPVAFSLGACGLFYFVVGVALTPYSNGAIQLAWPMLHALPDRIFSIMTSETMLAIPFFTLMGLVLERSGMAEDLLETIGQVFGTVRGGLAYAVIFVGALLAATTGVVAASVISMGLISLPVMLRYGYDRRVATGVIAASGTLAQIIPPSLVLIVMAEQLQKSVGEMYAAAFVPGLMLAGLYAAYIFGVTLVRPEAAPGLPAAAVAFNEPDGATQVFLARLGGAVLCALALYYVARAGPEFVIATRSTDLFARWWAALMLAGAGATGWAGLNFVMRARDPRGAATLLALALGSALVGSWLAGGWRGGGTDASVLGAAASILVAIGLAAVNWMLNRMIGVRFLSRLASQVVFVMVPPLFLIFLVLGTIYIGLATPTEGGAMGATGAIGLAAAKRWLGGKPSRFNLALLSQAVEATAKLTAFAMFILAGTRIFSLTFYAVNGQRWIEHLLVSLPGGQLGFLIFVNALVFFLAFFLEFFELAFIVVPLLVAPALSLGIDLVWLGIMLGVNMQTSFMHPPFGYALFYLRSVAPSEPFHDKITGARIRGVTSAQIYYGAIPFVIIQCLMVALVIAFPQLVLPASSGAHAAPPAAAMPQGPSRQVPGLPDVLVFPERVARPSP